MTIYGDRVKFARNKLGLSRMKLAVLLDMTERSIANIENCKDESKKLGFDKMLKLIEFAELPKGYFFYDDDEFQSIVVDHAPEVYAKLMRGGTMLDEELIEVLSIAKRINHES